MCKLGKELEVSRVSVCGSGTELASSALGSSSLMDEPEHMLSFMGMVVVPISVVMAGGGRRSGDGGGIGDGLKRKVWGLRLRLKLNVLEIVPSGVMGTRGGGDVDADTAWM